MTVNGFELPQAYTSFLMSLPGGGGFCNLKLKSDVDSFGNSLETELAQVYVDEEELIAETERLKEDFVVDGFYGDIENISSAPGAIPDITDFSKIVCFGMAGDGSQFCFDFRLDVEKPSVIWWDDDCWRKISNDFSAFISLFSVKI